jgi:DNA-directed RNA polymerase specialized sigma24 family protein
MPDELDRELLKRFVEGDQNAFESFFRQFETQVYRWLMRIVRDSGIAEDVLVEAFWRAYRGRLPSIFAFRSVRVLCIH